MDITIEYITHCVQEWTTTKIGNDFEFREHQLDTIVNIIKNILDHKYQNYIVEAPTGSGKSLINIISAGVLAEYFDLTSYILCSDLYLWDQYEKFLNKHKKTKIALLKGQTGNYTCKINNEDMRNADCKMAGISWASLFNTNFCLSNGYECALSCEYVKARKKAIRAKVCVMTYQLFLFIMNNPTFNTDSHNQMIFKQHDVLFCDECHNIPEIVQLQYSPTITEKDFERLESLYLQSSQKELTLFSDIDEVDKEIYNIYKICPTLSNLRKEMDECWKVWTCIESRKDEDSFYSNKYLNILEAFNTLCSDIKNKITLKKQIEQLSKDDIKMFKLCSWYENYMCHWHDYCNAINTCGNEYLLKEITIANNDNHISVSFKCTKEDFITYYFLLRRAQYKVMLSATIGSKESYDERMGFCYDNKTSWEHENSITNESYLKIIPSTFNFEKSPIHFLNKFKMSYKERDISFKHLKTVIYSICSTKFKNQKGMIQTGSYEFAKKLYNDAPYEIKQRMLIYNGSKEKVIITKIHKLSEDTILVGPTLNTGIDLPGDDCRFIIIMKVPYPSLANKLVNERNKLYPLWYNSHTSNEIIQGIGRGVRYNGDWCVTYILDACFLNLYISTKDQYPVEIQERINFI